MNIYEFRNIAEEKTAKPDSEEGQAVIHNGDTHVSEIWEDGEITVTKSGDLYGARNLHQSSPPLFPEGRLLFDVPSDQEHVRRVITDDSLKAMVKHMTIKITTNNIRIEP
jgi:hypothetical protein